LPAYELAGSDTLKRAYADEAEIPKRVRRCFKFGEHLSRQFGVTVFKWVVVTVSLQDRLQNKILELHHLKKDTNLRLSLSSY
jgi:hypothetical protein